MAHASARPATAVFRYAWLHRSGVFIAALSALALPISTAATSVGKVLLLVCAAIVLLARALPDSGERVRLDTVVVVLALIALLAASLGWTVADSTSALKDLVKYGKLLVIPALIVLLPTHRDARLAIGCYAVAQIFIVLSSLLLGFGFGLPWVRNEAGNPGTAVFTDYLTQSIMTATFAALCWVLRDAVPGRHGRAVAIAVALLALVDTLYFLPGRSGWVVAAALLTLIAWWQLPRRWRGAALLAPLVLAGLLLASDMGRERLAKVVSEADHYVEQGVENSSSGERLNFWHRSLQSFAAHPLTGSGVGSWQTRYHELEGGHPSENTRSTRNPHNEYLLLGVQAGVPGMLLFVALLVALCRDARRFEPPVARAIMLLALSLAVASLFNSALFDGTKGNFFVTLAGLLFACGTAGKTRIPRGPADCRRLQ